MLEFKQAIAKLNASKEFKDYLEKNKGAYIINAIYMNDLQINYFSPKTELITVFKLDKKISLEELEKEERTFPKLNIEKIKFDLNDALKVFKKHKTKFHSSETSTQTIIVLQTENNAPIWNISEITFSLKLLNIRISAENLEIIHESFDNMIDVQK